MSSVMDIEVVLNVIQLFQDVAQFSLLLRCKDKSAKCDTSHFCILQIILKVVLILSDQKFAKVKQILTVHHAVFDFIHCKREGR